MIQIPQEIKTRFTAMLANKIIPDYQRTHYIKWLRYYLDFCSNYHLSEIKEKSLQQFIKKLQQKHQTSLQQKQASHAISLYYSLKNQT